MKKMDQNFVARLCTVFRFFLITINVLRKPTWQDLKVTWGIKELNAPVIQFICSMTEDAVVVTWSQLYKERISRHPVDKLAELFQLLFNYYISQSDDKIV